MKQTPTYFVLKYILMSYAYRHGQESPRTELLHNIDSASKPVGEPLEKSPFDVRISAALRVGNWKIITGSPGNIFDHIRNNKVS